MKRIICAVIAASVLAAGPSAPRARAEDENHEEHGEHAEHGKHFEKMLKEKLGLTDDQAAKLKAAWEAEKTATEPLRKIEREATRKLEEQVRDLASNPEIQATLDQLDSNHKALMAERQKAEAATASVLKPYQRAKMRLMMHRMMAGGMKHGDRGHDGRDGGRPHEDD